MTPASAQTAAGEEHRTLTLVWIDAREAVVVEWRAGAPSVRRIASDVPAHHRSTGHVRHDPSVRHGGGGRPQTAGEPHRLEHLARFVAAVADRLPGDADVLVLGPGTVREQLEGRLRAEDERHDRRRAVQTLAARRLTDRQLVARLRAEIGQEPARRRPR